MKMTLENVLAGLGFKREYAVAGMRSLSSQYKHKRRTGIYVLHFANGEFYAGQAKDVIRRFNQHAKNYHDIEKVSFKPVGRKNLNEEEKSVIHRLEKAGFHLRNIVYTSVTYAPSAFDEIVSSEDQEHWLNDTSYTDWSGERRDNPELRRKYSLRFEQFMQLPQSAEILEVLQLYVRSGIPAPRRTEMDYWSCSCLPGMNSGVVTRFSINHQEVFSVHLRHSKPFFTWNVAKTPIQTSIGKYQMVSPGFRIRHRVHVLKNTHVAGGSDQVMIKKRTSIIGAKQVIQNPEFLYAIRSFNLRPMRKGPNFYFRSHCFDLADLLLQDIT